MGWLDPDHAFPTGEVCTETVARLAFLIQHARTQLTRGFHRCELCPLGAGPLDQGEVRVVGADGKRYAAPVLVKHYIESHRYRPPDEFRRAVLASPHVDPDDAEGRCLSCGGDLTKGRVFDDLVEGVERRPVILTQYDCRSCDVGYDRVVYLESGRAR